MVYRVREVKAQFSQPVRQIVMMLIVTAAAVAGAYVAYPRVEAVFLSNPWLNGVILAVFFIGVLACFLQVFQLISSVSWIEGFAQNRPGFDLKRPPRLLAPLAALLRSRGARMQIGATSSRSILDSVATRLDEARDITRYIINLLIFLGLLGTFYGLATTVPAVVETIRSLAPAEGEGSTAVFSRLISGLETQLGGMGTAFSSSLLGLAGSLVVGLLELFAGHGQNRFYRELEEWLSTITRVGFTAGDGEATAEQSMFATMMDQLTEQFDALHVSFLNSDRSRAEIDHRIGEMMGSLDRLTRKLEDDSDLRGALLRVADGQEKLTAALDRFAIQHPQDTAGEDTEIRMRLRSIDVQMLRLLEELSAGRHESMAELRQDMTRLIRTIEAAAHVPGAGRH